MKNAHALLKTLNHGRETYAVNYGDDFVLKRPLPTLGAAACNSWLSKQHRTKKAIDEIRDIANPAYNVPEMLHINDDEYQILEQRAPGQHLTPALYASLSLHEKYKIQDALANFLVDMNELKPVSDVMTHQISTELKFKRLENFINGNMTKFFTADEIERMDEVRYNIGNFSYQTRQAWSHGDLNSGNVLYDPETTQLSFIDFAEAGYKFIYRDIFAPLQIELGISKPVYEIYNRRHNKKLYSMPAKRNTIVKDILKYRTMVIHMRRFIRGGDDLRTNPQSKKSVENNLNKIEFMREQMQKIFELSNIKNK